MKYILVGLMNQKQKNYLDDKVFFDTKEEMIDFVKSGNKYTKPEHIKVGVAFKMEQLNNSIFAE